MLNILSLQEVLKIEPGSLSKSVSCVCFIVFVPDCFDVSNKMHHTQKQQLSVLSLQWRSQTITVHYIDIIR